MAQKLSTQKRQELFEAFCEQPSVYYVSKKCKVSPTTARRYRDKDKWVKRFESAKTKAEVKTDRKVLKRFESNIRILDVAKKAYSAALLGIAKTNCPKCNTVVSIPIPNLKAKLVDIDRLLRLEEYLLGGPYRGKERGEFDDMSDADLRKLLKDLRSKTE